MSARFLTYTLHINTCVIVYSNVLVVGVLLSSICLLQLKFVYRNVIVEDLI